MLAHTTNAWIDQFPTLASLSSAAVTLQTVSEVALLCETVISAMLPLETVAWKPPPSATVPAGHVAVTVFGLVSFEALAVPETRM
jgi:hypothetical protein